MPTFAASSKKGGQVLATPEATMTPQIGPEIPTPYPNVSQSSHGNDAVQKVLIENKETVVESSKIPSSSGDEAGTLKGLVSNTNMDQGQYQPSTSKVRIGGELAQADEEEAAGSWWEDAAEQVSQSPEEDEELVTLEEVEADPELAEIGTYEDEMVFDEGDE